MYRELLKHKGVGDGVIVVGRSIRCRFGLDTTSGEHAFVTATFGEHCWGKGIVIVIKEMEPN